MEAGSDWDSMVHRVQNESKRKTYKRKKILLYTLLALSITGVVVCVAGLGYELYTSWHSQRYYASMASDIESRPRDFSDIDLADLQASTAPSGMSPDPAGAPGTSGGSGGSFSGSYSTENLAWQPYIDFEEEGVSYPGLSAWIRLESTLLDYPVMKWTNNSYFLGHLPDGSKNRSGSVFLDYRNNTDFTDKNTLIYGHESRIGEMFGSLKNFRRQAFYDENPIIYIFTPDKDYALVLFSAYLLDSGVETPPMKFRNDAAFENHIKDIKRRSFFRADVEVGVDDKIVSLCTCAYDYTNARLIVVGKLVVIGSAGTSYVTKHTQE